MVFHYWLHLTFMWLFTNLRLTTFKLAAMLSYVNYVSSQNFNFVKKKSDLLYNIDVPSDFILYLLRIKIQDGRHVRQKIIFYFHGIHLWKVCDYLEIQRGTYRHG